MAITKDLKTGPPSLLAANDRARHTELLRQIETAHIRLRDPASQRRQRIVELTLIGRILIGGDSTELAGSQDAERWSREVNARRCRGNDQQADDGGGYEAGGKRSHNRSSSIHGLPPTA